MQELGIWIVALIIVVAITNWMTSKPSPDHGDAMAAGFVMMCFYCALFIRFIWLLVAAWF